MRHRSTTQWTLAACALFLLAGTAVRVDAATSATPAKPSASHARAKRAVVRPGAKHAASSAVPASKHAASSAPKPKPAEHVDGMPRTLDDVHIEGEIAVPQVLFITAREQRRFMDFQHHRFMRNSKQLGEETPYPTWVAVTHDQPIDRRKEKSP